MSQLGSVVQRLVTGRAYFERLRAQQTFGGSSHLEADLAEITDFGSNPGDLRMFAHIPHDLPRGAPLAVVLHGCGQTAGDYAEGAGWLDLADRHHFAVLAPEQQAANNPKTCFNWFQRADTTRDMGEAGSIRQMIERLVVDHGLDRARLYITGLSAGGAMATAMLALYPDLFAAGAIVAGLPFRAAVTVPEAFEAMFQGRTRPAAVLGDLVRTETPASTKWPRIMIWQGDDDSTVVPGNADELVKQWTNLHGVAAEAPPISEGPGVVHRRWTKAGQVVVEEVLLAGVAHGTPVATTSSEGPRPYMLDVGVSSSEHIARFFQLIRGAASIQMRQKPTVHSGLTETFGIRPADYVAKMLRAVGLQRD
jgi:poly(hydroxyalkanoate) depolymerase family esterase